MSNKLSDELQKQVKEMKKLAREEEIASGVHRYNSAGAMEDKKKKAKKYGARKKSFDRDQEI